MLTAEIFESVVRRIVADSQPAASDVHETYKKLFPEISHWSAVKHSAVILPDGTILDVSDVGHERSVLQVLMDRKAMMTARDVARGILDYWRIFEQYNIIRVANDQAIDIPSPNASGAQWRRIEEALNTVGTIYIEHADAHSTINNKIELRRFKSQFSAALLQEAAMRIEAGLRETNMVQFLLAEEMGQDIIEWIDQYGKKFRELYEQDDYIHDAVDKADFSPEMLEQISYLLERQA